MVYIGSGQYILSSGAYKKSDYSWIIGETYLRTADNLLISLRSDYTKLQLHFSRPISGATSNNETPLYRYSTDDNWLTITPDKGLAEKQKKINSGFIKLQYKDKNTLHILDGKKTSQSEVIKIKTEHMLEKINSGLRTANIEIIRADNSKVNPAILIDKIMLDGELIDLVEFYENYLDKNNSKIEYYFFNQFNNISTWLSINAGYKISLFIQFTLISMLAIQLALLFLGVFFQPPGLGDYFRNPRDDAAISIIDTLSNNHAISIGFLGTIISIWIALESNTSGFNDFEKIISIFKIAIFTTVLGLAIKMICSIRGAIAHHLPADLPPGERR